MCEACVENYSAASDFFLVSENMSDYAEMVLAWAATGYASELDLFVTRAVLWLAEKQNLRDANSFFAAIRERCADNSEFNSLPLVHFCDFLLQTLSVGLDLRHHV